MAGRKRRLPFAFALLLYLTAAWALVIVAIARSNDLAQTVSSVGAFASRDLTTLGAAVHVLAPGTPLATWLAR